jgi:predicted permease
MLPGTWLVRQLAVMVDAFWRDLRYAVRTLSQRPLLSAVAVASLALGIGVNTAVFSLFDSLLLRRLPVLAPDQLVNVLSPGPKPGSRSAGRSGGEDALFSHPLFRDLERVQGDVLQVAAHCHFEANLAYHGQTSQAAGLLVSGSYFPVLRLTPARGRLLDARDDAIGASPVIVLGYDFWKTRFGGDPAVVGAGVVVNGEPMTIAGVAAEGFSGTTTGQRPDLFVPLAHAQRAFTAPDWNGIAGRNNHWLYVFGRRPAGLTRRQTEQRINVPFAALIHDVEFPALRSGMGDRDREAFQRRRIVLEDGDRGRNAERRALQALLMLLFAVTGVVLAIACANVANLLLARGASRTVEISLRLALGAPQRALVRLLLVESAVLGLLGAAGALMAAQLTVAGLRAILPAAGDASELTFSLNGTALFYALGVGLVVSLLTGLVPAIQLVASARGAALRAEEQRSSSRSSRRVRASLATGQIALATALLALAGLFAVSLVNISRADLGIRRDGLVAFTLSPERNGYPPERSGALFDRVEAELRGLPDVISVSAATIPILANEGWYNHMQVEGRPADPDAESSAAVTRTGTGYFRTLGVPLLAGRDFTGADVKGSARVAVVNEAFARKFSLAEPIGRRMAMGRGDKPLDIQIVGLVADMKYSDVRTPAPPQFYLPYRQEPPGSLTFYVRTTGDPRGLFAAITAIVRRLDDTLPVAKLQTMDDQISANTSIERLLSTLSWAFAGLAIGLAVIGLYGVVAYGVAQRTREIGIRIAVGASPGQVHQLVLGSVGRMAMIGGALGCAAAFGLARLAQFMLFGIDGMDPRVVAGSFAVMAIVAVAAGALPSWRAAGINPVTALRSE